MNEKLKPCPFCGGEVDWCDCGGPCHIISCPDCGDFHMTNGNQEDIEEVKADCVKAWNIRVTRNSIDDASPDEWDAVSRACSAHNESISRALTEAQMVADTLGHEVYIVNEGNGLKTMTSKTYRPIAVEIVHPSEKSNAEKSS